MTKLLYSNRYTTWTRDAILEAVKSRVTEARYEHILRVEETAIRLADHYSAETEAASLASILHDYAKDIPRADIEVLVDQGHLPPELLDFGSQIWHGPAAAYYAQTLFGIQDQSILDAIAQHTIGGQMMPLVSQIVFIADYIEPGRQFPGVEEARRLADQTLESAVVYKIKQTLLYLIKKEIVIYPETFHVYNKWMGK
ncbi:bis(5'-nucleosyl)-tetraphosphatase (symmetrical) YqeK [Jeotgalibaca sp. PTS2502]|uniref:bis(5'-nucleosyl)-tetraphosphatase (symmetrical) YqeK n=1 Tax=Jeotgalibaca sp. PTS2502 TaxID=1903686 RepID=UPI0018DE26F5|nr:bis(5'-nucleosyl)-tetraphosphatase (symmetrical) YqeK [Jeotgalibaca sp. PTS2502]